MHGGLEEVVTDQREFVVSVCVEIDNKGTVVYS